MVRLWPGHLSTLAETCPCVHRLAGSVLSPLPYYIWYIVSSRFDSSSSLSFSLSLSSSYLGSFLSSIESWSSITWAHRLAGRFSFILAPHLYQVHQIIDDRSNRFIVSHKTSIGFYSLPCATAWPGQVPERSCKTRDRITDKKKKKKKKRERKRKKKHILYIYTKESW